MAGWWFSSGTPVSSINKTARAPLLLKVALNIITPIKSQQYQWFGKLSINIVCFNCGTKSKQTRETKICHINSNKRINNQVLMILKSNRPIRTINFTVNERHNYISLLDKLIFEQIHKGLVFFLDDVTRLICIF